MTLRFFLRLFLALMLVSNSLVSTGAGRAPRDLAVAAGLPVLPVASPLATAVAAPCHDAVGQGHDGAGPMAATAGPAPADGLPHCCNDVGHCVCALQAHAPPALVLPPPGRSSAGQLPPLAWLSQAPVPLFRPPIS